MTRPTALSMALLMLTPGGCDESTGWKQTCSDYRHGWHAAPYDVTTSTLWVK